MTDRYLKFVNVFLLEFRLVSDLAETQKEHGNLFRDTTSTWLITVIAAVLTIMFSRVILYSRRTRVPN